MMDLAVFVEQLPFSSSLLVCKQRGMERVVQKQASLSAKSIIHRNEPKQDPGIHSGIGIVDFI